MISRARVFAFVLVTLCFSGQVFAGGSIGWDEVVPQITKDDPFLTGFIAKNFDVSPIGIGVRVGHDKDGNSLVPGVGVGTRIPPIEFYAKPKGAAGDYTLCITLEHFNADQKDLRWQMAIRHKLASD